DVGRWTSLVEPVLCAGRLSGHDLQTRKRMQTRGGVRGLGRAELSQSDAAQIFCGPVAACLTRPLARDRSRRRVELHFIRAQVTKDVRELFDVLRVQGQEHELNGKITRVLRA